MQIPRLHPDTIEQVKQQADIVDVISERVVLRKRGKDYVGLCPFHDEKSPSFTVSPSKQLYYCFGCNAGGNAIKFLMEVGKQSFADVVLDLAHRYQVPVQTLAPEKRQELQRKLSLLDQLYEIVALAKGFYQHVLRQPQGEASLSYLKVKRRLSEETIQQFQLGYAPQGWDTLYRYLVEQKNQPVQLVEKAGLILPRKEGNGYYDRFRNRIMIPIHDVQGRTIGFGGRTTIDEQPKYLNSPETPLFNKGKTLFGLDKARDAISKQDKAVVVEGYFDAIALHAAGVKNAVASLGTALSLDQVRLLLRYSESKTIILNFDADAAGNKAAERAIGEIADLAYKGQVQLRVLNLPEGKDPDEFLSHSPDATQKYQKLLQTSPLWIDWQIDQLVINKDLKQGDIFQKITQKMIELLGKINGESQRIYYISQCAERLASGNQQLKRQLEKSFIAQFKKQNQPILKGNVKKDNSPLLPKSSDRNLLQIAESLLLIVYLHCPEYREIIIETLEEKDLIFTLPHHRFLWQQILELEPTISESNRTPNPLMSLIQQRSIEFPKEMAQVNHLFHLSEKGVEDIIRTPMVIRGAAACMEIVSYEKHRRYCLEKWQKLDPTRDLKQKEYYWQELKLADKQIKELEAFRQSNFLDIIDLT
ncbi:MAG TPA: DNA primase [Cyanobacteria bacterium UBA11166]|nr:DNA primase [Cyanobacteria bacterium UBA11166]